MRVALLFLGFALVACSSASSGGSSGNFPSDPLASQSSDGGRYTVTIRTSPAQPPTPGTSSVDFDVADATTHAPVTGLTIAVVPWMPAMSHGSSVTPTVTEKGDGHYVADDVSLYMQGEWQLRVTLSDGGSEHDETTLTIDVP